MDYPILILHGWGGSSKSWLNVKEILENKGFKVFTLDFPGFGQEPPPQEPWGVQNYAEWIKDFCEKKGISQFFLLGHSFGGRVAIKFAALYPGKIIKLILVDAAGTHNEKKFGLRQRIAIKLRRIGYFFVMLPIFKKFYPFFRKIAYIFAGTRDYYLIKDPIMKETFKKIVADDLTHHLFEIKMPTLIIWGQNDKLVPVNVAHFIKEKISQAKLEIFSKVGHNPHFECPEKLTKSIIQFLK